MDLLLIKIFRLFLTLNGSDGGHCSWPCGFMGLAHGGCTMKSQSGRLVEDKDDRNHVRQAMHERDLANGEASVWLPHALDRKYPSAHKELKWQFLFASAKFSRDPKTGKKAPSSFAFRYVSGALETGCSASKFGQARDIAHVSAFICYPLVARWDRYSNHSGVAGP